MKEYIYLIITMSLLVGVCRIISPEGGLKKYVGFLGALCVVSVMLMPIGNMVEEDTDSFFSNIEFEEDKESIDALLEYYGKAQKDVIEKDTEERLKTMISSELEVSGEGYDVDITIEDTEESFVISNVRVVINKKGLTIDPQEIKNIISSLLSIECEIIYDMKERL